MSEWMYLNAGEQGGPESEETIVAWIQSGQLAADSMVWQEGMEDWVPANTVIEGAIPPAVLQATQRPGTQLNYVTGPSQAAVPSASGVQQPGDLKWRNYSYSSVLGLGKATKGLMLASTILVVVLFVYSGLYAIFPPNSFLSSDVVALLLILIWYVTPLLCLASFVCLCVWKFRAAVNVAVFERDAGSLSPGWAAGGYFIPVANLVIPFMMMNRIWSISFAGEENDKKSLLVALWWLSWCGLGLYSIVGPAFTFGAGRETSAFLVGVLFFGFAVLIGLSGGALFAVIGFVSAKQDERAQELVASTGQG